MIQSLRHHGVDGFHLSTLNLEKSVRLAKEEGHLDARTDPAQIAFELNSLFLGANFSSQLRHDSLLI